MDPADIFLFQHEIDCNRTLSKVLVFYIDSRLLPKLSYLIAPIEIGMDFSSRWTVHGVRISVPAPGVLAVSVLGVTHVAHTDISTQL